ncbi:ABC transporter ATP-binding protein [Facklamia miroungae]|uniref:ABC-2 type transport system ATP-binding protein n=1 Tax=Facklamia miroungae TaxID=120956 RepID=A0A1G7RRM7_9LACT|nr:ABC transporter ATP-binding protein [Facklamia miroungae]NKZ29302.1 ABC transporter ATP-binding protein [Facklamia miroungae]SDG13468.1 ABC-2 type transport system ATP-binding protein [Facklamia miroungae]
MSYIEVKNVFKKFGKQEVLNNITFSIEEGERFGLIGPNGAGKSTLIDIITGLTPVNSGQVLIDGMDIRNDRVEIRKQIGLVPQEIALLDHINAKGNLEYFGSLYNLDRTTLKQRVTEALEMTGLRDDVKKTIKAFSGGMKRRLNIAAALLHHPRFLILDEPTVGVDPQSRNKIFEFIKFMNEEHQTTILYTSHYMEEIENLTQRLFILDQGVQVAYGYQDDIKAMVQDKVKWIVEFDNLPSNIKEIISNRIPGIHHLHQEMNRLELMVDPSQFKSTALFHTIAHEELELNSLYKEPLSLEEAFLQLTGKRLRD